MQCDENAEEKVVPHDGEEDECSDSGYFYGCVLRVQYSQ